MLRRVTARLNRFQHQQREQDRMRNEQAHRTMYDANGNLRIGGSLRMIWHEFGTGIKLVVGFAVFFYVYEHVLIWVLKQENAGAYEIARSREEEFRQSGANTRGERFVSRPARQIDDPDILNYPTHGVTGSAQFRPKLFDDDRVSTGYYNDDSRGTR